MHSYEEARTFLYQHYKNYFQTLQPTEYLKQLLTYEVEQLSEDVQEALQAPFTLREIETAIGKGTNKNHGQNDFPYDLYHTFKEIFVHFFTELFHVFRVTAYKLIEMF